MEDKETTEYIRPGYADDVVLTIKQDLNIKHDTTQIKT